MTEMTFDIKIQNMRQLHCLVYHDNFCFRGCDVTFCVSSNQRQRPKFGRSTQISERFCVRPSFPLLHFPSPSPSPSPLPLGRPDTQARVRLKSATNKIVTVEKLTVTLSKKLKAA